MISQKVSVNKPSLIILDVSLYKESEAIALAQIIKNKLSAKSIYLVSDDDTNILAQAKLVVDDSSISKFFTKTDNVNTQEQPINNFLANKPNSKNLINLGNNYFFDSHKCQLFYNEEVIVLSRNETTFLELIMSKKGYIITFEEVIDYIWGENRATENSVRTLVYRLRKKLKADIVKTAHSIGYYI